MTKRCSTTKLRDRPRNFDLPPTAGLGIRYRPHGDAVYQQPYHPRRDLFPAMRPPVIRCTPLPACAGGSHYPRPPVGRRCYYRTFYGDVPRWLPFAHTPMGVVQQQRLSFFTGRSSLPQLRRLLDRMAASFHTVLAVTVIINFIAILRINIPGARQGRSRCPACCAAAAFSALVFMNIAGDPSVICVQQNVQAVPGISCANGVGRRGGDQRRVRGGESQVLFILLFLIAIAALQAREGIHVGVFSRWRQVNNPTSPDK